MKRGYFILFSILFLLVVVQFVSSSVEIGANFSLKTEYSQGERISGIIPILVTNEPASSYIKINFNDQVIPFKELVERQNNFDYSCSPSDCGSGYSTTNSGSQSKVFTLQSGDSETVAFSILSGQVTNVVPGSFSLNVDSTAAPSDLPQLWIDFFSDGSHEWTPNKATGEFGNKSFGCFNSSSQTEDTVQLVTTPYCEKINIKVSPNVRIGANLTGSGIAQMEMTIKDEENSISPGSCTFAAETGENGCTPTVGVGGKNFTVTDSGDFFVCIKQESGQGEYQLRMEREGNS